jgi:hypothetical protein
MEYARLTGVLNSNNLNFLQKCVLTILHNRDLKQEYELEELHFEQNMFINNPAMYQEYKKSKEENAENDGVVWTTPQTIEDAHELTKIFAEVSQQLAEQETEEERRANEEFIRRASRTNLFDNIDFDQMDE